MTPTLSDFANADPYYQRQIDEQLGTAGKRSSRGRNVTHNPTQMNKLEERYARHLDLLKAANDIVDWRFQPIRLRIADKCWYVPDYLVIPSFESRVQFHETKGHWEDDARVKIKACAELYPWFSFVAVQWHAGSWTYERWNARK